MADTFELVNSDGVRVRVEGLRTTVRALDKAGADATEMRDLMHQLGQIVVSAARPRAPHLSGTLATTIRAGRGKTKAVVRAGGARAPYAGVTHYGWPARSIPAQPFLSDALATQRAAVLRQLDKGLADLLRKHNLI